MAPLIAIIGRSKTGKTTLIEQLVKAFKAQGYRVGTVKHHRADFDFDLKGKDSWRHRQAGAEVVIMSSPTQLAFIEKREQELSLAEIQQLFENKVDLILAEGFKRSHYPKIEVYRKKEDENGLLADQIEGVVAIVTDEDINCALPLFRWAEVERLMEFIKEKLRLK